MVVEVYDDAAGDIFRYVFNEGQVDMEYLPDSDLRIKRGMEMLVSENEIINKVFDTMLLLRGLGNNQQMVEESHVVAFLLGVGFDMETAETYAPRIMRLVNEKLNNGT